MPESAHEHPIHQRLTNKVSYLLVLLVVGLIGLLYSAFTEAGLLASASSLLFTGLVLYHSWKHRQYLSLDGFGEDFEDRFVQIGIVYILVFVGGLVMWRSFQPGADHSQRGIAAVLLCFGAGLFWRCKHLFSLNNILRTLLAWTALGAPASCMLGVIGLLTGSRGRVFSEFVSPEEALQDILVGISIAGILAIEIWFPSIEAFIRRVCGKEHCDTPWRSF